LIISAGHARQEEPPIIHLSDSTQSKIIELLGDVHLLAPKNIDRLNMRIAEPESQNRKSSTTQFLKPAEQQQSAVNANAAILEAWQQAIADQIVTQRFTEADEPDVLTGISEMCARGDCEECPGHGEHEGKTIFCVHPCHQVSAPDLDKIN
jgi:hypothetical protein